MSSPLDRPPVLRRGSLDAHAIPSGARGWGSLPDTRWADGCRPPAAADAHAASRAPTHAGGYPGRRHISGPARAALGVCRFLARLHRISPGELAATAPVLDRSDAIAEVRRLVATYHLTRRHLFGR